LFLKKDRDNLFTAGAVSAYTNNKIANSLLYSFINTKM
jgi:hypothetical protein